MPDINQIRQTSRQVLHALQAETATGQTGAIDASQFLNVLFLVNITASSGTSPTLTVLVDISDDGGATWLNGIYTVVNAVSANGGYSKNLGCYGAGGDLGDTFRLRWTLGGTTPSVTFKVTMFGK